MIAFVKGIVAAKTESACVVLTPGGVGYLVGLTLPAVAALGPTGSEAEFFVMTIVREDALELYGFATWDERSTFETLLSITKVGPKLALAILSQYSPDDLRRIVLSDDYSPLVQVPGIGKKSAQRIFVELKYKLEAASGMAQTLPDLDGRAVSVFRDALAGLVNLGYDDAEAREVLEKVFADEPGLDVAMALREALKRISRGKAN
ncbi:Holliday junction DNA helicase RuvA [Desulfobaculum xiamenense]|uniref:Holliday junction branch migration complex subunit RuvA n=1 Tax=Desulfobaculum xiamenense TaxID=995050 RepID=A0A846QTH6_9BACT|nr:Holliday junction branch migration protein RuvA [Desulfobaculum xiamenense]NJB68775.1 Holliday junction DNA helicase RuvA [Desulfobaculum xiamenense]